MKQAGFIPILIAILLTAAALGGYLIYSGKIILQNTPEEISIQRDLAAQLNTYNTSGFEITVSKIVGNYATGGAGVPPQGSGWIAIKENGRWRKIWDGVNNPSCSTVNQYKIPKEIYGNCSTNY